MKTGNKNILLTGASSGLGKALFQKLSPSAKSITLVVRNVKKFKQEQTSLGKKVNFIECDLSSEKELSEMLSSLGRSKVSYDIVINCAGIGSHSKIKEMTPEQIRRMLYINCIAPVSIVSTLVSSSRISKKALVVNIGSIAGELDIPSMGVYSSSKALIHSFTRSVELELEALGIRTLLVILGSLTGTNFGMDFQSSPSKDLKFYARFRVSAESAAEATINAIQKNKNELVYPGYLTLAIKFQRYFPFLTKFIKSSTLRLLNFKKLNLKN